jgi:hypothetical protein
VRALALHTTWRFQREDRRERVGPAGETILTDKWMRGLLREVGAPRKGWKAAAAAIKWLQEYGLIEDTGRVLKPRVPAGKLAAREKFEGVEPRARGGRDAQFDSQHSYWWRVFRVVPIARVLSAYRRMQGTYGQFTELPHSSASLSALLRCQGLISPPSRRSSPNRGSVQVGLSPLGATMTGVLVDAGKRVQNR